MLKSSNIVKDMSSFIYKPTPSLAYIFISAYKIITRNINFITLKGF